MRRRSRAVDVCWSDPKARSGLCSRKDAYAACVGRLLHVLAAKRRTKEAHHESVPHRDVLRRASNVVRTSNVVEAAALVLTGVIIDVAGCCIYIGSV